MDIKIILLILAIIAVVITVVVLMQFFRAVRIPKKQSIIAFTGTLGSGKTYLAVTNAIRAYRRQALKNKIYKLFVWLPKRDKVFKDWKYPATLYSNIPVRLNKDILAIPLLKEDLLERGRLPEKCIVLIDEIGAIASQWEFDNPLVQEQLEKFVRFFRHWLDGKMFVTDQVADNIVKPIRSRLGIIYQLHDFRRWIGVLPFYKVTAIPLLLIEDTINAVTSSAGDNYEDGYFFGMLPYKKDGKKKLYQSRCYKPIYTNTALRSIDHFDENLYTRYLIDISVSRDVQKDYAKDKSKYKSYLYDVVPKGFVKEEIKPVDIDIEQVPDDILKVDL